MQMVTKEAKKEFEKHIKRNAKNEVVAAINKEKKEPLPGASERNENVFVPQEIHYKYSIRKRNNDPDQQQIPRKDQSVTNEIHEKFKMGFWEYILLTMWA